MRRKDASGQVVRWVVCSGPCLPTAGRPARSASCQVVRDHVETFRAQAASLRDGDGLPRFVEREFREFLRCGWLAGGFARLHCGACGLDRLVAFSCKGRGCCPSCGGRRMAERAAHCGCGCGLAIRTGHPHCARGDARCGSHKGSSVKSRTGWKGP